MECAKDGKSYDIFDGAFRDVFSWLKFDRHGYDEATGLHYTDICLKERAGIFKRAVKSRQRRGSALTSAARKPS